MEHGGIEMVGEFKAEVLPTLPVYQSGDKGRILFAEDDNVVYFGDNTGFKTLTDVPTGTIMLFDSAITIVGYTLLTDVDDQLVYISKNSGGPAGGPGGQQYTGSTWTQPNHTHPFDDGGHEHDFDDVHDHTFNDGGHIHSIGSHTHEYDIGYLSPNTIAVNDLQVGSSTFIYRFRTSFTSQSFGQANRSITQASTGSTGSGTANGTTDQAGASGTTDQASAIGTTDGGATASSWRPKGRNFTRQQKN